MIAFFLWRFFIDDSDSQYENVSEIMLWEICWQRHFGVVLPSLHCQPACLSTRRLPVVGWDQATCPEIHKDPTDLFSQRSTSLVIKIGWCEYIFLGLLNCVAFSFNIFVHRSGFIFLAYMNLLFAWPCPKIIDLPFTTCWNPTAIYQMHPLSQWACSSRQRGLKALIVISGAVCLRRKRNR